jgi:hypothetical protein
MIPEKNLPVSRPSFSYWAIIVIISCSVILLRFGFNMQSLNLGNFVVSCISAILVALLIGGLVKFKAASSF